MTDKTADKSMLLKNAEKELAKRQLQLAAPRLKGYFILMLIVVLLNYIIDMFASSINGIVYSDALLSFIGSRDVSSPAYTNASLKFDGYHSLITGLTLVILPLYKSLSDKFGRKLFLWLNTLFTGIGMFIMLNAKNVFGYAVGYVVISFFFSGDVHQLYLIEEAPKKYRTTIGAVVSCLGSLAASGIGILYTLLVTEETAVNGWRNVMFILAALAVPIVLISVISLKDTSVFLKKRVEYLTNYISELSGEGPKSSENANPEAVKAARGGIFRSFGFIFSHRQTRMIFFVSLLTACGMVFSKHYSTMLNFQALSKSDIGIVATIFPIVQALFAVPFGFLSDKIGRKFSYIVSMLIGAVSFPLFMLGASSGFHPVVLGLMYGLTAGGYWTARNTLQFNMMSESAPTHMRASVVSILGIFATAGYAVYNILLGLISNKLARGDVRLPYTIGFVAAVVLAVALFAFGVRETKDSDLDKITGEEYEVKS